MTSEQRHALADYLERVRAHYGARYCNALVFGSRARGDSTEASDLDLAIILDDGDWDFWQEKLWLAGETFQALVDTGLHIQPWPVQRSRWESPDRHANPALIKNMRRDARLVQDAA